MSKRVVVIRPATQVEGGSINLPIAITDVVNLQSSLNNRSLVGHIHSESEIDGLVGHLSGKAATSHTHEYEPIDNTILRSADIGVTVANYNHSHTGVYAAASGLIDHTNNYNNSHQVSFAQVISTLTENTDMPVGNNDFVIYGHTNEDSTISYYSKKLNNFAKKYKTKFIPGDAFQPSTTNGSAYATLYETTTNKNNIRYMDFAKDAIQYAEATWMLPLNWDGGTITAQFFWTCTGGSSSAGIVWGLKGRSFGNNELLDQELGTAQTVTDTWETDLANHKTSETSAITLAGTPAAGELIHLKAYREGTATADNLAVSARLLGVVIKYSVNSWSD